LGLTEKIIVLFGIIGTARQIRGLTWALTLGNTNDALGRHETGGLLSI